MTRSEFIRNWVRENTGSRDGRESSVAVVGIDGLFPKGRNIDQFWRSITEEEILYDEYPGDYLYTRSYSDAGENRITGGLIDTAFDFDPGFFKISNSEAELMDPQLRQLLISVHRSIEDSGYTPGHLSRRTVGVFVGSEGSEYNNAVRHLAAEAGYDLNHAGCSLANRISYQFDFKGPSEVIDTMCSSAAYCIQRATELLRSGEIDVAVVGAAKLHVSEETYRSLRDLNMTCADRCYSFHRDSKGYIRSEGIVTIVLKSTDAAVRDGDHIYANIREVVSNYNGRDGNSMFTPSKNGQKELIKKCYGRAGAGVSEVAFIEAQGMGNEVSDFVEFSAINEACSDLVYGEDDAGRGEGVFPVISTLKPILGHMECVSALGALLKIILIFRTKTVYRIPGLSDGDINEKLIDQKGGCELLTANRRIDSGDRPLLAGLNSFGASGTNVHMLVEAPVPAGSDTVSNEREQLLVVSAHSQACLRRYVDRIHSYLHEHGDNTPVDGLCRTFQTGREHYRYRAIFHIEAGSRRYQARTLKDRLALYLDAKRDCVSVRDNLNESRYNDGASVGAAKSGTGDGALFSDGLAWLGEETVDWIKYHGDGDAPVKPAGLPTYPFELKPYRPDIPLEGLSVSGSEGTAVRRYAYTAPAESTLPFSGDTNHDYVQGVVAGALSKSLKTDSDDIAVDTPFADYGVDSITGVNLVRTLNERLGVDLDTTVLFDYSTISRLSGYIVSAWPDRVAARLDRENGTASAATGATSPGDASSRAAPLRRRVEKGVTGPGREPIAIIGMSGRFGGAESLNEFWQSLRDGENLVRAVSRWPAEECVSARGSCTQGSFIDSIDMFDPGFFNISPLEAVYMDPQQRLFLEESWRALEDAGYAGRSMDGRQCGVYAGCNFTDYTNLFDDDPPEQAFWGIAGCVIPARIAYYLNLMGPAVMVDTACSSSLVSVHMACQSLWSGETDMAIAGGVFLQVTPSFFQYSNRAGMLSPQGRCAAFDASADGFVPGEGVGVVVLKPMKQALHDRDSIHAVILGSGTNQDGKTNGITAPSARSQEELQCSVYERFDINPETIQLVEAHGTGTKLGDPVEFGALSRSFARYTDERQFCAVGSVKTNIGHTSAAAGIAGMLKAVLSLKNRRLPRSLHFNEGNPLIDFELSPFYVNTRLREWETLNHPMRRAAVSSFGFSGTNAHMVIEEAPVPAERAERRLPAYLIVLSACTEEQLRQQVWNLLDFASHSETLSMNDAGYTLFVGRMHRGHRFSCIARDRDELIERLRQWLDTGAAERTGASEIQEGKVKQKPSLKRYGNQCIRECRNIDDSSGYLEELTVIADLYMQGYELDYHLLFSDDSRRISMPTYPFARERYWIDSPEDQQPKRKETEESIDLDSIENLINRIDEGSIEEEQGVEKLKALV